MTARRAEGCLPLDVSCNKTMSKKEFFWGAVVVVAGLVIYQVVAPFINSILDRVGIGGSQPAA